MIVQVLEQFVSVDGSQLDERHVFDSFLFGTHDGLAEDFDVQSAATSRPYGPVLRLALLFSVTSLRLRPWRTRRTMRRVG